MPRAFVLVISRCLALLLVASNFAAAGVPVHVAPHAVAATRASSSHHHCGEVEQAKPAAHAGPAAGCPCCDGQGCQCLHAGAWLSLLLQPGVAPSVSTVFARQAVVPASLDVTPRLRPPILRV